MMERIILRRPLHATGGFHNCLSGFTQPRSTAHSIASLYCSLAARVSVLLGIKGAIDTVQPDLILAELARSGFKRRLLRWIISYLTGCQGQVRAEGSISPVQEMNFSIPQDGVLSPTLFNILMHTIASLQ
ncbi:uncharacterized protein [Panulirus ornatus]|uniref:uncharacterized protein n=1 Tax=Panulirus ornatus TaxID=150431 RepID=UPI003A8C4E46